jgi:hypothetical protein
MINTYPEVGNPTTDAQYSKLARNYAQSGVLNKPGTDELKVFAKSNGLFTYINPGQALVRGFLAHCTKVHTMEHTVGDSNHPRYDLVVYRLHQTAIENKRQGEFLIIEGEPSSSPKVPDLVRTDTYDYDLPLAKVLIKQNAVTINPEDVSDLREYQFIWNDVTRPKYPNIGDLGYNDEKNRLEVYNGNEWKYISTGKTTIVLDKTIPLDVTGETGNVAFIDIPFSEFPTLNPDYVQVTLRHMYVGGGSRVFSVSGIVKPSEQKITCCAKISDTDPAHYDVKITVAITGDLK